jgi:DNA-binding LacI/PurR family transcriptional regulator
VATKGFAMTTMKEVALRAGVSESTVSHVINKTRQVSEEKREMVLAAMRELGFAANAQARGLARGRSDFLGMMVSDIENPFFPGMIKAFESAAREHGFDVLLFSTNYDMEIAERACRKLVENKASAVAIMTSQLDSNLVEYLSSNNVKSVMLDGSKVSSQCSSLRFRYEKGAVEGVQCLFNLGHRDIAMIAGPQNRRSHISYRTAVEAAGWALNCKVRVIEGRNTPESGYEAVEQLLTGTGFPTAILCSNDLTAIGAIQALTRAGLRVPEDVSIVGADDIPMSQLMTPSLTTIHMPRQELGQAAFQLLHKMLNGEAPEGLEVLLDTRLVLRASTSAPRDIPQQD